MKLFLISLSALVGCVGLTLVASQSIKLKPCWCWTGDQHIAAGVIPHTERNEYVSYGAYDSEADWNNPQRTIALDYSQAQGKQVFYQHCVWCHADATPAGPSNRSNVTPDPPLMNDGAVLNKESDVSLQKIIALGGSAVGKSAMMPPYGKLLTQDEISDVIAYIRAIAVPEFRKTSGQAKNVSRGQL